MNYNRACVKCLAIFTCPTLFDAHLKETSVSNCKKSHSTVFPNLETAIIHLIKIQIPTINDSKITFEYVN